MTEQDATGGRVTRVLPVSTRDVTKKMRRYADAKELPINLG